VNTSSVRSTLAAVFGATLLLAGCRRGEITMPVTASTEQITVDASAAWAYADLSAGQSVVETDAQSSMTWDIGFNATNVVLNGGANGPAGVTAYCICQNAAATNDEILAMTPESEGDDFSSVTSADVPSAAASWSNDVFATSKWYRYDLLGDHRISPTFDVYLVKRGATVYKLQVTGYYGPAGETRRISFRYAALAG
jgi:hypothetical protein